MKTEIFFSLELHVHFTRYELSTIMSALAEFSWNEHKEKRSNNGENAWKIREKVNKFCEIYDKSEIL